MTLHLPVDYAGIAPRYDSSRRAEPAIVAEFARRLKEIAARSVVEIGAGTGNYTLELNALGFDVIAVEPSAEMAARGSVKAHARWVRGDAALLPFRDGSVDAAVCVNVLHHLPDYHAALAELRRAVRRGVVLQAVVRENLSSLWYREYFPEIDSILLPLHPGLGELILGILQCGFRCARSTAILYSGEGDLTFEAARTRPHLLFDPGYRAATSGFRRLPGDAIDRGLARLRRDLDSGRFAEIASSYEANHARAGDCVVITAAAA